MYVIFQIPEFDNLYLDMNGIIHVCSHPEDDNPHFRITEEKIFADIMYYIEVGYSQTVSDQDLTLKAPRKKCIWKCRLLKSSVANICLTLLMN